MTTTATPTIGQAAEFWRVARRLYTVYAELDRTFELGMPPCLELDSSTDSAVPEAMERVVRWLDQIDQRVQVWQLRQLLQSTNLQNEENLRYLIARHLEKKQKTEADKDKIDFLLVQYFAHCSPHGLNETSLAEVGRVLEPPLGSAPQSFPDWAPGLDERLKKLNESDSLEELQNSGALQEVRELKLAVGDDYFQPGFLVAFTRFNFLARRAFFRAMHLDLHAIRAAVNQLEQLGISTVDCRDAGLTEGESLEQVRHVVHQWKTPFRAPYSGGSSFLQLILLRHALQLALDKATWRAQESETSAALEAEVAAPLPEIAVAPPPPEVPVTPAPASFMVSPVTAQFAKVAPEIPVVVDPPQAVAIQKDPPQAVAVPKAPPQAVAIQKAPPQVVAVQAVPPQPKKEVKIVASPVPPAQAEIKIVATPVQSPAVEPKAAEAAAPAEQAAPDLISRPAHAQESGAAPTPEEQAEEEDYLMRCVADITEQLKAVPAKNSPSVSAIMLGGCKLLIATWEAQAFAQEGAMAVALQRTVAARTILHVCMERHKKNEPTDLTAALDIARGRMEEIKEHVEHAKESKNIDAAVNLSATSKRLASLIAESEKLTG